MALSKEKLVSLNAYKQDLKDKIKDGTIPIKHKDHPAQYLQFLRHELSNVVAKLDANALESKKD